jgi:hypothetical protein
MYERLCRDHTKMVKHRKERGDKGVGGALRNVCHAFQQPEVIKEKTSALKIFR